MSGENLGSGPENVNHRDNQLLGAHVLSSVNFEDSHKDIVQNSFERARDQGEKIEGDRPNIRRNYAYLDRLSNLVEKHGNRAEQRLCRLSATKLILKEGDIPEKFWERENRRSIERGDGELTDETKEQIAENIQERQKRSVEKWSNYLGDEGSPFPLWFKSYVFDGISKMGRYDGDSETFLKRRKGDVSSYPNLNEAALSQVYQAIVSEDGHDPDVEQLVNNGNFNQLYSKFYTEQNRKFKNIELPKNAEDVQGKWIEYGVEQINELFTATSLNGCWCIGQDYGVLEGYFNAGRYIHNRREQIDAQESLASDPDNKSKFILFHPSSSENDEALGVPLVSIRLNKNGEVAEISGVVEDDCGTQILNDALVSEVKQKVLSLPGGEKYKKAFEQREQLIDIQQKIANGEHISGSDLAFLWNPEEDYCSIGEYEKIEDSSKLLDAKEKTREMFVSDFNHMGENRGAVILSEILTEYGLGKSAELVPQIVANGVDLAALAEWTMLDKEWSPDLEERLSSQQIKFGNVLLENGLSVEDLSKSVDKRHAEYRSQTEHENTLLLSGIDPKSILESLKNDGKRGSLSIEAYGRNGLALEQIIPFVDLTDYDRWEWEFPNIDLPDDVEFRKLFDQTAIEQFRENYELEKRSRPDGNDNAFDKFIQHIKSEKEQHGYLEHIDDAVEIARDTNDVDAFLECGADPDEVLNKLLEFSLERGWGLGYYDVNLEALLGACRRRGRGPIMPDYVVSNFDPNFVAQYAKELMSEDFGASEDVVSKKIEERQT